MKPWKKRGSRGKVLNASENSLKYPLCRRTARNVQMCSAVDLCMCRRIGPPFRPRVKRKSQAGSTVTPRLDGV